MRESPRPDLPGVAGAASAMLLLGTLAGVSAVIKDYPIYGGQALRYGTAALILLVLASARRVPSVRPTWREILLLVALAAVGIVLFNICVIAATRRASPATVGTVIACVPVVLAVAGPPLRGTAGCRRPSARVIVSAGVVVAGAALTTSIGTGTAQGLLLATAAVACEAGFTMLAMPLLPRLGAIRVAGYAAAAAAPMALLLGAIVDGRAVLRVPTAAESAGLAYLAVVVSTAAIVLWYGAVPRLGPDRAGLFAGAVPVGATVTTLAVGAGRPTAADLAGTLLVVAGILIGMIPSRRERAWDSPGRRRRRSRPGRYDAFLPPDPA